LKLTALGGTGCANGVCPTVYETDKGTIVVQGFDVHPDETGMQVPAGEGMVEVPRDLLEKIFGK